MCRPGERFARPINNHYSPLPQIDIIEIDGVTEKVDGNWIGSREKSARRTWCAFVMGECAFAWKPVRVSDSFVVFIILLTVTSFLTAGTWNECCLPCRFNRGRVRFPPKTKVDFSFFSQKFVVKNVERIHPEKDVPIVTHLAIKL